MLFIDKNNNIKLTRGDTAILRLNVTDTSTGNAHELTDGDVAVLTVKASTMTDVVTIQKALRGGVFVITPDDTAHLEYGTYRYDVQITMADGAVYTVIAPARFTLTEEVSF